MMKKLLMLPLLFLTTIVNAQFFQPGIKAGVNISNFTGGNFDSIQNNALTSFHAGAFLRFNLGNLAIQPELIFSSQGAKLEYAGNEEDYKINYVNVPVMIQFTMGSGFYFEGGPQVGFKISEDIPSSTIEDFAKDLDLAIGLGLGYHSKMGLGIGGRYNVGVSKVGDYDSGDFDPDFKQGVLQISLFYTFFNKKK